MKQFITLICLATVLGCGGITKPCTEGLVDYWIRYKYISPPPDGSFENVYEKTLYQTEKECRADLGDHYVNGEKRAHYCQLNTQMKEVCE